MKRNASLILSAVLAILFVPPMPVGAQTDTAPIDDEPVHRNGGLGFHSIDAPLGGRFWFSQQKIGVDFGLGCGPNPLPARTRT